MLTRDDLLGLVTHILAEQQASNIMMAAFANWQVGSFILVPRMQHCNGVIGCTRKSDGLQIGQFFAFSIDDTLLSTNTHIAIAVRQAIKSIIDGQTSVPHDVATCIDAECPC